MIETQIGGKFSREDLGLFDLKKRLQAAGVKILFPEGDNIIQDFNGIPITFDINKGKSFYEVETDYLEAIKQNPFHVIYNKFKENLGYIGESASVEMVHAMLYEKPVIILYPPKLAEKVPNNVREIIERNRENFTILRLDLMDLEEISKLLTDVVNTKTQYHVDKNDKIVILDSVNTLLESYRLRS